MKLRSTLCAAAAGLALMSPSWLHAQTAEDDLLRPMIVRPADSAPAASNAPLATPPATTPAPIVDSPIATTAALNTSPSTAGSSTRLQLPPPPAPSQIDLGSGMGGKPSASALMPAGSPDIFTNFGPPSGSSVSDRVFQLRDEALGLRQSLNRNMAEFDDSKGKGAAGAIQYHSTVAAITARLEAGTTRGNPILLRQWSEAEQSLGEVNYSISRLNMLSSGLAGNSSAAAYLLQAVRAAYELSGALDEDHDQLAMIRDETAKMAVQVDRLRQQVNADINRQNSYLAAERRNLQTLSVAINRGELIRNSFANQSVVVGSDPAFGTLPNTSPGLSGFPAIDNSSDASSTIMPPPDSAPVEPVSRSPLPKSTKKPTPVAGATPRKPIMAEEEAPSLGQLLVLVRFNQEQVDYEQPMYQAVSTALDRNPDASFTVVAVTPKGENIGSDTEAAQRHADEVKSSLVQLGLQPSRINLTGVSSEAAQTPEVHVYIR